jgi:hypothetical protein
MYLTLKPYEYISYKVITIAQWVDAKGRQKLVNLYQDRISGQV